MSVEVFVHKGEELSDTLLDWLEYKEFHPLIHEVSEDDTASIEALGLGLGRLPIARNGSRIVIGLDIARIEELFTPSSMTMGLEISYEEGKGIVVTNVAPQSKAEIAGFQNGDQITSFQGYESFSFDRLKEVLFHPNTARLAFGVRREDGIHQILLKTL